MMMSKDFVKYCLSFSNSEEVHEVALHHILTGSSRLRKGTSSGFKYSSHLTNGAVLSIFHILFSN